MEDISVLFGEGDKNDFVRNVTNDILLIIDDDYWTLSHNTYKNLLLLGIAKNNVIITAQTFHDVFGDNLSTIDLIKLCNKCGWDLGYMYGFRISKNIASD